MSRKISIGAALALALLMVAASIPLTMLYAQREHNKLIEDLPKLVAEFGALQEIQNKVGDEFYKKPARDAVNIGMVRGYIAGLRDPQSRYLSAQEYKAYMQRLEGKTPELGIVLKYSPEVVGLVIDQVKAGSTAAVSGLLPGDHITKAETGGVVLESIKAEVSPDEAAAAISKFYEETAVTADTASVAVTITYKRGGAYQPPVNVMLGSDVSSVSTDMLADWADTGGIPAKTVGYIKIHHFFSNTADQLEAAVKALSAQNAMSYILDVRGCSEGNLESVCKAIDLFAGVGDRAGAMVTVNYRNRAPQLWPSDENSIVSFAIGHIAVLIDGNTSGAAELFAYDLRAYNPTKVFLVGTPTKGVRTVQEPFPLPAVGGAALLTVGELTPYGAEAGKEWAVAPNEPLPETDKLEAVTYSISGAEGQLTGAVAILTKPREKK
ncbi:MAG: S41 family peptidase [Firmicutes bacterium]|nr:S41 family peptidase [Bacillota bacterium]